MLISSSGLAYAQHFCGGMEMMAEITVGESQLYCGMDGAVDDKDCGDAAPSSTADDCCKNHITKVQTDEDFAKTSFDVKFNKEFVATFISVFVLQEIEIPSSEKTLYADYNPPPLQQDLNILYDTFLI
mgnify:CR=1 FL=1